MFDGLEIDVLSLGDADCIVVTHWHPGSGPQRILIDGGNADNSLIIKSFLRSRNMTDFWAVVCTHAHNDHASGLIRLVQDRSITIHTAWMHDIRNHLSADALRSASAGSSSQAENVKQVWETTKELAAAFAVRGLTPQEPFSGQYVAVYPDMVVLGPSRLFYQQAIEEFTKVAFPNYTALSAGFGSVRLSDVLQRPLANHVYGLGAPAPFPLVPLAGLLGRSSVKESPTTQPFNNTSAILGITFKTQMLLLTADAGSEALDGIPLNWKSVLWMQVPHHGSDGNLSRTNIERFCPKFAYISARGDKNHPSRAIVNGLRTAGATVCSTHSLNPGHLWFWIGTVPHRENYSQAVELKATSNRTVSDLARIALSSRL